MIVPASAPDRGRLRVLFADDDCGTLVLGRRILEAAGHQVFTATDGEEALISFHRYSPDVVLLDLRMPRMDGIAVCRAIKAETTGQFVPVIFVTSAADEDLVRCLDAGGDGFLSKPLNPLTLNAQLQAFRRIRDLHSTIQQQSRSLREHQNRLLSERQLAAAVFDRVLASNRVTAANLRYFLLPASRFAGDLILAAEPPCGGLHVLLADFTGHGLPAAIGAIPVSDFFHAATASGTELPALLRDLNRRVASLLPAGMFMAATAVALDPGGHSIAVWNGCMPDALLFRASDAAPHRFRSRQPPLGVIGRADFDSALERCEVAAGDRLYLMSDGVTEGGGEPEATYGEQRVLRHLQSGLPRTALFDYMEADVREFHGTRVPQDDLAMVELTCRPSPPELRLPQLQQRLHFHMDAAVLRSGRALQQLVQSLTSEPVFAPATPDAVAILCELFTNALEHGLLRLDSRMKRDAQSFAAYHAESERRTRELHTGWIRVDLEHRGSEGAGRLAIRVSDSGSGFDFNAVTAPEYPERPLFGRGLLIVRELASRVAYEPDTNTVEALLTWTQPEAAAA